MKNKPKSTAEIIGTNLQRIVSSEDRKSNEKSSVSSIAVKTERVWLEMTGIFGRSFEAQFGEAYGETFKLWAQAIEPIEPEKLRGAMTGTIEEAAKKAKQGKPVFPPNLPEFLSMCKEVVKHPMHQLYIPPPDQKERRKAGVSRLAEMRKRLGA